MLQVRIDNFWNNNITRKHKKALAKIKTVKTCQNYNLLNLLYFIVI